MMKDAAKVAAGLIIGLLIGMGDTEYLKLKVTTQGVELETKKKEVAALGGVVQAILVHKAAP